MEICRSVENFYLWIQMEIMVVDRFCRLGTTFTFQEIPCVAYRSVRSQRLKICLWGTRSHWKCIIPVFSWKVFIGFRIVLNTIWGSFSLWLDPCLFIEHKYSQTCIKKSPLGYLISCVFTQWKRVKTHVLSDQSVHLRIHIAV